MSEPKQAWIFHPGKYYVQYKLGERSKCMPKHNAKDYAEIFGGTVHRDPAFPTIYQRIKALLS